LNSIVKQRELDKFYVMREDGASLSTMARAMGRRNLEITLLIVDRAEAGMIKDKR
jgi:hypothetical protein